jgi:hypothetical protein
MKTADTQWIPAKHLILGDDPQLRVYAEATVWFKKIESFRKGEMDRMINREPTPEDLAVHRLLLRRLITDGEHLLSITQQVGFPEDMEGFKIEDLMAAVDTLRDTFRGWHQPLSPEKRTHILQEVFSDGPKEN